MQYDTVYLFPFIFYACFFFCRTDLVRYDTLSFIVFYFPTRVSSFLDRIRYDRIGTFCSLFFCFLTACHAEVGNLGRQSRLVAFSHDDNVPRFDVPVDLPLAVHVAHPTRRLVQEPAIQKWGAGDTGRAGPEQAQHCMCRTAK